VVRKSAMEAGLPQLQMIRATSAMTPRTNQDLGERARQVLKGVRAGKKFQRLWWEMPQAATPVWVRTPGVRPGHGHVGAVLTRRGMQVKAGRPKRIASLNPVLRNRGAQLGLGRTRRAGAMVQGSRRRTNEMRDLGREKRSIGSGSGVSGRPTTPGRRVSGLPIGKLLPGTRRDGESGTPSRRRGRWPRVRGR